jgi:pyridoxal phosphate enzyme (YggS family)
MTVEERFKQIQACIPENVRLIAVSKTHPVNLIQASYDFGHRHFGENKVQELLAKKDLLPSDIVWHMIGHLQSNKVKFIAPFVGLIHGVDSFKLLNTIDKEASKNQRVIPCLLQVHIAEESTKFGFSPEELYDLLESQQLNKLENIEIRGLMGMATFTEDKVQVRREFKMLKSLFDEIKQKWFLDVPWFCEISMGMSDDFQIAIEEGSTMVRVGSALFGERDYS